MEELELVAFIGKPNASQKRTDWLRDRQTLSTKVSGQRQSPYHLYIQSWFGVISSLSLEFEFPITSCRTPCASRGGEFAYSKFPVTSNVISAGLQLLEGGLVIGEAKPGDVSST